MDTIFQHFRKEEQPFIELAYDWIQDVEQMYAPKLTDFLNPRERFIVESLLSNGDIELANSGQFEQAERQRVLLYPNYYVPEVADFQVAIFRIKYPTKFVTLEHKDVLGSLMGLGIDRSKFGDIRIDDEDVQFAVADELKDYVQANFVTVGKSKISIEEVQREEDIIQETDTWKEEMNVVSSMRLDTIVAAVTSISRQKAVALIKGEKVRVNWATEQNVSAELFEEDVLSIRGFGRFKVIAVEGRTRKDKIRLITGALE